VEYGFDVETAKTICRNFDVSFLAVFGSRATGKAHEHSDIDFLIRFDTAVSLLVLVRLKRELSEALKKPVDIVTEDSLNPLVKDHVLSDMKVLYA